MLLNVFFWLWDSINSVEYISVTQASKYCLFLPLIDPNSV